jgi:polyphenol oxidase
MLLPGLHAPSWQAPAQISAFVSSRSGGVSAPPYASFNLADHVGDRSTAVAENRQRLADRLPTGLQFQWLQQVHGNDIVAVNAAGGVVEADAITTRTPGIACCVLTADCLPLFLASRHGDEVALVHAGWRGMAAGIIENSVAALHTRPADLLAWLGPAIGPCHFEVGEDVKDAFLKSRADAALEACFQPAAQSSKFMADLYALARLKLRALGVTAIDGGDDCSYCNEQQFFSYRRDGVCGRNLSLIYLTS